MKRIADPTTAGPATTWMSAEEPDEEQRVRARRALAWPAVVSAGVDVAAVPRDQLDAVAATHRVDLLTAGADWLVVLAALGLLDQRDTAPGRCRAEGCATALPISGAAVARHLRAPWIRRGYCSRACDPDTAPAAPLPELEPEPEPTVDGGELDSPNGWVWRYLGQSQARHLIPANGRDDKSPCGRNPVSGWRGTTPSERARMARLKPCGNCLRIVLGDDFQSGQTAD